VSAFARALSALPPDEAAALASALEQGDEVEIETLRVAVEHVEIRREPAAGTAFAYEAPFGVSLDLEITPDLRREGLAREFVHQAQALRRDLGLDITDRIELAVAGPDEILHALREYEDYVTEELLASALRIGETEGEGARALSVDGTQVSVTARKS
jgi:isoleucyl-tRNA synthetase